MSATRGGPPEQIGDIIARAARRLCMRDAETGDDTRPTAEDADRANRMLASIGLRVVFVEDAQHRPLRVSADDPARPPAFNENGDFLGYLAVANTHAALNAQVFRATHWAAQSGTSGGWKAPLQEAPGNIAAKVMKFGGVTARGVMVPLGLVLDGEGEMAE